MLEYEAMESLSPKEDGGVDIFGSSWWEWAFCELHLFYFKIILIFAKSAK